MCGGSKNEAWVWIQWICKQHSSMIVAMLSTKIAKIISERQRLVRFGHNHHCHFPWGIDYEYTLHTDTCDFCWYTIQYTFNILYNIRRYHGNFSEWSQHQQGSSHGSMADGPSKGPPLSMSFKLCPAAQDRENDRKKGILPDPRMMMHQAQGDDPSDPTTLESSLYQRDWGLIPASKKLNRARES